MLLDNGGVRFSEDLVNWGRERVIFPPGSSHQRFCQTSTDHLWAVYSQASLDEELYTSGDVLIGFYVRGGKRWKRLVDIWVTSTVDGKRWTDPVRIATGGEPTEVWAFPVAADQVAVAALYNRRFLKWHAGSRPEGFRAVNGPVRALRRAEVGFFVQDERVICTRTVRGRGQENSVLQLSSTALYESLSQ